MNSGREGAINTTGPARHAHFTRSAVAINVHTTASRPAPTRAELGRAAQEAFLFDGTGLPSSFPEGRPRRLDTTSSDHHARPKACHDGRRFTILSFAE